MSNITRKRLVQTSTKAPSVSPNRSSVSLWISPLDHDVIRVTSLAWRHRSIEKVCWHKLFQHRFQVWVICCLRKKDTDSVVSYLNCQSDLFTGVTLSFRSTMRRQRQLRSVAEVSQFLATWRPFTCVKRNMKFHLWANIITVGSDKMYFWHANSEVGTVK